ncbi:VOC family protein [Chitinophaga qingshengii]|uniref:VOC family protein n=1 Tax=Chitinophaga qingshengii TaxID=1569794 RepID=A0ABR7TUD1_9BACT|nr:VOC family protein [Chitinophaga qingshengii]MBC9934084.1 VOC family protein [Chitinophaga qingshengii]
MKNEQKITPFLWFNNNAEEAIHFYKGIFKDAEIGDISRYTAGAPLPEGTLMTATFRLEGLHFIALNGGPYFTFNEAVSFVISCETADEVDHYWNNLTADGGAEGQCGWLKDKFGVSWQVVPTLLGRLLGSPERDKAARAMQAMMGMKKLDMQALQNAFDGK